MAKGSKRWIWIAAVAVVLVGGTLWKLAHRGGGFRLMTAEVSQGPLNATVSATGTVNPVLTVHVGSQVSGTVLKLYADYNSHVTKNELIAELDPAIYQAQLDQAIANLEKSKVTVQDAKRALDRAADMFKRGFLAQADRDAAETTYLSAVASQRQSDAAVTLARVNLDHCLIRAPIEGIVISRSVDVGQTVAASLSAPELFLIANDLSRMQVETAIDEADVGKVRVAQPVTFSVDAFPDQTFRGSVREIRAEPSTVQNVVTYTTVIDVENPENKLMPGMTANVNILIAHRDNVLRVPNAALRFKPADDMARKLGLTAQDIAPLAMGGGGGGGAGKWGGGAGGGGDSAGGAAGRGSSPKDSGAMAANAGGGAGGGRHFGGSDPRGAAGVAGGDSSHKHWKHAGGAGGAGAPGGRGGAGGGAMAAAGGGALNGAGGGEAPFGKHRARQAAARVYVEVTPNHLKPVILKTGLSDGQFTEVTDGDVTPGQKVATAVIQQGGGQATTPPPGMGGPIGGGRGGR